ncbi:MarR family winged helix-turn-helix transcriptional regulator [Corynebacterium sp. A21]|uniref:MarR family winged helix-turn-helix transcriptional regulator n=1 Tax=Corynebacterium sp. A21 TaxID=3457318 RepID=UPI003FD62519
MGDSELVARVRIALQRQLVDAVLGNEMVARQHGLLVTDLQTLHLLVLREDVRTPRQISATTGMPASTVTKLVDRLEAAGYLRRTADPNDRRRTILELVPEKIEPLRHLYGRSDDEFDALTRTFNHSELETIISYLESVSAFYQLGAGHGPRSGD